MILPKWIKITDKINPQILGLIENTFLGSRGARYRLLNTKKRAAELDHPKFLYIERNNKAIGNITLCNRITLDISENYIRYFAFDKRFRSNKDQQRKRNPEQSILKRFFSSVMDRDVFEINSNYCYYAFVDDHNFKSMNMADQFRFQKIGSFRTTSFSRSKPKSRLAIRELTQSELEEYSKKLESTYNSYNFYHPTNIEKGKVFGYFQEENMIMAATFHPTKWSIQAMPGKNGELKIALLSKMPILKSFFKNKELHFLGIEGIVTEKYELSNAFFESVLFEMNYKCAMIWSDISCIIFKKLEQNLRKGILARFSKQEDANIIVKHNMESSRYLNNPTYISSYDIS